MKFKYLQIETHSFCNARCIFCHHPKMRREKGTMTEALFRKIIDDAAENHEVTTIYPMMNGEPFFDKRLPNLLQYINKKLPNTKIVIYTNGQLLDKPTIDKLFDIQNIHIHFSINAFSNKERYRIMGIPLKETVLNIKYIISKIKEGKRLRFSLSTISKRTKEGDDDVFSFTPDEYSLAGLIERYKIHHYRFPLNNWAGKTFRIKGNDPFRDAPCGRVYDQLSILWDGRVCLCCLDGEGEEILGDTNTQTLEEIYNSPRATEIRDLHTKNRRSEISLCRGCTRG